MAPPSLLEALVSVAQLSESTPDIYVNEGPLIQQPIGDGAFGGSVIGQAVSAASSTVSSDFDLYASQSSFLRPVKAKQEVTYHVERITDGRTYCTRVVRVTQGGGPCRFVSIMAFQRRPRAVVVGTHKSSPTFADPMPDMRGLVPYDLPKQGFEQMQFQIGEEEKLSQLGVKAEDPFDWRLLPFKSGSDPSQARVYGYVRANTTIPLTLSSAANAASLALLSDQSLFELSVFANWESVPEEWRRLAMTVSLNSRISFHVPTARVDEWMVCESGVSWGANGRISADQRFWSHATGELLMSCTQDAVVSRSGAML
ncbi:Acyl-coenzyme A thioesterase 8 [Apiospora sp. TS-2023a]